MTTPAIIIQQRQPTIEITQTSPQTIIARIPVNSGGTSDLALGETSTTAYRGDRGKEAYDHSLTTHAPANAEQNVNADWNAVSGDAQILNKPVISGSNTGDQDLSSYSLTTHAHDWDAATGTADVVPFNAVIAVPPARADGKLFWDTEFNCLAFYSNGCTLQIGQEGWARVRNQTGSTITAGKAVSITGALGDKVTIGLTDVTVILSSKNYIGVTTEDIVHGDDGFVTTTGLVNDLNTAAWSVGDKLWVNPAVPGGITNVEPPNSVNYYKICVGFATRSHISAGRIHTATFILPKLENLSDFPTDVSITEVGYLSNVSRDIQAQLDGKQLQHGFVTAPANPSFATNTFTLPGSTPYTVAIGGVRTLINTDKTVTISTPAVGTQYFIWMKADLTLASGSTQWDIMDTTIIPVATAYYNAAGDYIIAREWHQADRNLIKHKDEHEEWGAQYVNGFTTLTVGTGAAGNATNTFSLAGGEISDEGLRSVLPGAQTQCRIGYRDGTNGGKLKFDTAGTAYAKLNAGVPQYDNAGTLTNVSANQVVPIYIYASNRIATPVVAIVGQGQHTTLALAQAATLPTLTGMSVAEWKLLYIVYIKNQAGALAWQQSDAQYQKTTGPAINAGAPSTMPAGNVVFTPAGNIAATNVQTALEELDSEKLGTTAHATTDHTGVPGVPSAYTHPTGDGNLHVPATSTINNGKVLTAGATAGALTWETPATGSNKFKIGLPPAAAELVGSVDEPLLVGVASGTAQNPHWSELQYSDTAASEAAEQEAMWVIPGVVTKDYAAGNITVRLRWYATAITGNVVWRVKLLGCQGGEVLDAALITTAHTVTAAVAGTTLQLVTSEITFTPAATELTAADLWFVAIRRSAFDAADTMSGVAKLVDAGVFEV